MAINSNLSIEVPSRERFKQTIRMLSAGACNPTAFPKGEITIYPWDISVDDWVVTKGKFQQSSMYEILPVLADLNGCKPDDLYVGDAATILLVSRSMRHGNSIQFSPVCPHCKEKNPPESVKIPEQLRKAGEKPIGWNGVDTIKLPESGDEVVIRPLRVKDEKFIEGRSAEEVKAIPTITAHLVACVVTVGGGKPDSIVEVVRWFRALSASDQDYLSRQVDELHPRLDNEVRFKCEFCQGEFGHKIDLEKSFFRSGGDQLPA